MLAIIDDAVAAARNETGVGNCPAFVGNETVARYFCRFQVLGSDRERNVVWQIVLAREIQQQCAVVFGRKTTIGEGIFETRVLSPISRLGNRH